MKSVYRTRKKKSGILFSRQQAFYSWIPLELFRDKCGSFGTFSPLLLSSIVIKVADEVSPSASENHVFI